MSTPRRAKIEAMLAADPQDVYLLYSLAMEDRSDGELESAVQRFQHVLNVDPAHSASYFQMAQLLQQMDRIPEARAALEQGIVVARSQGDDHAVAEMSGLLDLL